MSHANEELGHGHSVAAWTAVIVAIIGVSVVTLGVVLDISVLNIIGSAITLISIFLGPVMAKLGYGVAGKK
jgi:hypothetical protein